MAVGQLGVFTVKLTYCAPCSYTKRAMSLADTLLNNRKFEYFIKDLQVVPSDGGRFEFEVNDEMVFSKKAEGRHANEGEIEQLFEALVNDYIAENNIYLPDLDD